MTAEEKAHEAAEAAHEMGHRVLEEACPHCDDAGWFYEDIPTGTDFDGNVIWRELKVPCPDCNANKTRENFVIVAEHPEAA